MTYTIEYTTDFTDAAVQRAFRTYFRELGCRVTNWEGLFAAMGETGREYTWTHRDDTGRMSRFVSGINADERNHAFLLREETGQAAGFIQFTTMHMDSWFFTVKCGFIREPGSGETCAAGGMARRSCARRKNGCVSRAACVSS